MTTREKIEKDIELLKQALKEKSISVNEYCDIYYDLAQKLKSL